MTVDVSTKAAMDWCEQAERLLRTAPNGVTDHFARLLAHLDAGNRRRRLLDLEDPSAATEHVRRTLSARALRAAAGIESALGATEPTAAVRKELAAWVSTWLADAKSRSWRW